MVLTLMLGLPLVGALFILLLPETEENRSNIRNLNIMICFVNLLFSIFLLMNFNYAATADQFEESYNFLDLFYISYSLGINSLALFLIVLTNFIMFIIPFVNWDLEYKFKYSTICYLLLQTFILGTFTSLDLLLFYIFFELTLIPIFFIIFSWGGKDRVYAAYKLFFYTFTSSLFMLVGILYLASIHGLTSLKMVTGHGMADQFTQTILFLAFFGAFAIKIPLFPLHTWVPCAHVEAPTGGSIVLAALILKIGLFGMIRFAIPCFPLGFLVLRNTIIFLGVINIIYGSIMAMKQNDLKKITAYSSIAHIGFSVVGIGICTNESMLGSYIGMICNGIISASMFLIIGFLYERSKSRELGVVQGLAYLMPKYSVLSFIVFLATIGIPGTGSFISEFLITFGSFAYSKTLLLFLLFAMILGVLYPLKILSKTLWGIPQTPCELVPLRLHEKLVLTSFVSIILYIGIYPNSLISCFKKDVEKIVEKIDNIKMNNTEIKME